MSIVYEGKDPWWLGLTKTCNRCERSIIFERHDFDPEAYFLKSVKYRCKNCGTLYRVDRETEKIHIKEEHDSKQRRHYSMVGRKRNEVFEL